MTLSDILSPKKLHCLQMASQYTDVEVAERRYFAVQQRSHWHLHCIYLTLILDSTIYRQHP